LAPTAGVNYKWFTTSADETWLLVHSNAGIQGYTSGYLYLEYFDSRWFVRTSPGGPLVGIPGGPSGPSYTNATTNTIVLE